jgi:hypothetical protein
MPKSNTIKPSFAAGEISPLLRGRSDTQKYAAGVETCTNFIITPQGAARRRPGTKYLGDAKAGTKTRVYPFRFSNTDNYILEFGVAYVRIWRHETPLYASAVQYACTGTTGAPPDSVVTLTTGGHAYNGQSITVYLSGFIGNPEFNGLICSASGVSATDILVTTPHKNAYTSGGLIDVLGSTPIEVATPYTSDDLDNLYFEQSADVLYICHSDYQTRKLSRTSGITWALSTMDQLDGPYLPVDTRSITMTLSSVVDAATMVNTDSGAQPFVAGDVGEYVEFQEREIWQLAQVTAFTSASQVTVDIIGNTLVDFDPNVTLNAKSSTARSAVGATANGTIITPNNALGAFAALRKPTAPPAGYTSAYQGTSIAREGVDPSAFLTDPGGGAGTVITSNYGGTFSRYDVGKYLRISTRNWRRITGIPTTATGGDRATCSAAVTYIVNTPGVDALSITPGSRTITGTLTASSAVFVASDVGRHIRLNYNSIWVWGKITAYTSTTVVTVTLYDEPPTDPNDNTRLINGGRTQVWRLGSWSNTTGWPRTVAFHEQRLVFGGSKTEPHTLWFSRSADFENHAPTEQDSTVLDDNGIAYTLASNEVNSIAWLRSATVLLIGTIGGEWQCRAASSVQEPITPTNIAITPQTSFGSIDFARPIKIGSSVLFIQRSGQKVIELSYSFELDAWTGRDLNVAADHILKGSDGTATAKELAWCAEPYNLLWVRLSDGTAACCTYNRDQEVLGWHKHDFKNTGAVGTIGFFCSTPAPDNTTTRLYIAMSRTGARKIERLSFDDTKYADSYEDVALTSVSSITSIPSRFQVAASIDVNASTYVTLGGFTPSGSTITLGTTSNVDYYGFAYDAHIKLLPSEGGSTFGTAQHKVARESRVALRVYDSASLFHGVSTSTLFEETFTTTPFTGDKAFTSEADYTLESGTYYLSQTKSLPLTILSWGPQKGVNE